MYTAIKAVFNRSTRAYDVQVIDEADLLAAHEGWLVFNTGNEAGVAAKVRAGGLCQSQRPAQREALLRWLDAATQAVAAPADPFAVGCEVVREKFLRDYDSRGRAVRTGVLIWDAGTVVEVSGDRLRVYWHTYRADLPADEWAARNLASRAKRTWVSKKFLKAVA